MRSLTWLMLAAVMAVAWSASLGDKEGQEGDAKSVEAAKDRSFGVATLNSISMTIATELGDKTFCIAAVMAMRYNRVFVFAGAIGALIVMSILSVGIGVAVPTLLPKVSLITVQRQHPKSGGQLRASASVVPLCSLRGMRRVTSGVLPGPLLLTALLPHCSLSAGGSTLWHVSTTGELYIMLLMVAAQQGTVMASTSLPSPPHPSSAGVHPLRRRHPLCVLWCQAPHGSSCHGEWARGGGW